MKLKVLDLFSGIGGFSLGLERTGGFETVAFCEIEPFPRKVLAKHWPEVPIYDDVRTLTAERLAADGIAVDVITGGFPCQDVSGAGRRAGVGEGTRSGLYAEVIRLAGDIRPKFIILENVAGLLSGPSEQPGGWFGRVLADLASIGYDAEWENIPAAALGAPHRRERVWIISYPCQADVAAEDHKRTKYFTDNGPKVRPILGAGCQIAADTTGIGLPRSWPLGQPFNSAADSNWEAAQPFDGCLGRVWQAEPRVDRVVNGVSNKLDKPRLAALGNAVVPQIPELIGHAILQSIKEAA